MKLKYIIFFAASFTLLSCAAQKAKKPNANAGKNLGVQLYSVRDDISSNFTNTVNELGRMGFKTIEAANYNNGKFYGMAPAEFKGAIEAAGMKALSSHTGKPLSENIANTNWTDVWNWWNTAIAAHKAAGMKYIVTPYLGVPKTLADLKAYCNYFNKIGELCNKAGLKFGYHNHAHEFKQVEGQTMYDYMLQNTDPNKVFYEMDVYWTTKGGHNPVEYFKKYPGRFTLLHIKDEKELGASGDVDFNNIFKNAKLAGMKYPIVEVERYDYAPLESVRKSINYLLQNPNVKNDYSTTK